MTDVVWTRDALIANAESLLAIDAKGALTPHGIGHLAREIITGFLDLVRDADPLPDADLDAAEGADPTVVALEREAAAEIARLRTVEADNARLRSEVERLTRERDEAVAVLRLHHIMAVERGEIGLPDGDGGWIAINDGAEYCDSTLYNRTVQVIDQHPVFRPMPRGGWQQSQGWWENWLLETRMRRKAEAELTTLTARTREVLAPFAEWFPEEALRRVPPDQRLMTTGLEARHFRAANTLFNELKEKDNAGN